MTREIDADALHSGLMVASKGDLAKGEFRSAMEQAGDGLYLEFGVWEGGSIKVIEMYNRKNPIYGFDCWQGLPEPWQDENGSLRFCAGAFGRAGGKPPKLPERIQLVTGYFKDTLPKWCEEHPDEKIAFVNIDSDLYSSCKTVLTCLKDRLDGTVVHFDEIIGYSGWQNGEFKAFKELLEETDYEWKWLTCDRSERAAVLLTKPKA